MQLLDYFNKLVNKKKDYVGVSISSKSILEVVQFDHETNEIIKYGQSDVQYDLVGRQISNISTLEMELLKLFEELKISIHTPVVLSLPAVSLHHITLPSTLDKESVKLALVSEAEKNYVFKKNDPAVSWEQITLNEEAETQYLLYSTVKKEEVEKVEGVFINLGIPLVAVDASYSSLLRGLSVTGLIDEDIEEAKFWSILLITPNSFVIISLMGNKIIDISEDPLAIKSFNPEDIYTTIASYSMESISSRSPDHLIVISETDEVSAEMLSAFYDMDCKISFLEANNNNKKPIFQGDVDFSDKRLKVTSLEAIGTTCWNKSKIPINFNFMSNDTAVSGQDIQLFGISITLTTQLLQYSIYGLMVLSVILMSIFYLIGSTLNGIKDTSITELSKAVTDKKTALQAYSVPTAPVSTKIAPETLIREIYDKNAKILENINTLSSVIPEKLWIENFSIDAGMTVEIKGKALSVNDIIAYYQNLNRKGSFQNLKIASVKETSDSSGTQQNTDIKINPTNIVSVPQVNTGSSGLPAIPSVPAVTSVPDTSNTNKVFAFSFTDSGATAVSTTSAAQPAAAPAPSK